MTPFSRSLRRRAVLPVAALGAFAAACSDETTAPAPAPSSGVPSILQMQATVGPDNTLPPAPAASFVWRPAAAAGFIRPSSPIVAPDTVRAGIPFNVDVRTILPSPCWGATRLAVSQTANVVVLDPVDEFNPEAVCTQVLVYALRSTAVTINTPGVATLRVRGRLVTVAPPNETQATVERQVVVLRNPKGVP